jgi:hypothetical protein
MYDHRVIAIVHHGRLTVGFEYPDQAEAWAREVGGTWESINIYLAGKMPKSWTVHTAEIEMGHEPHFGSYVTTELTGIPNESQAGVLMITPSLARAIGTDRTKVHQLIEEWRTTEWAAS